MNLKKLQSTSQRSNGVTPTEAVREQDAMESIALKGGGGSNRRRRKLHKEELHKLSSSPDSIRVVGYVEHNEKKETQE
jgi:hypothetical protein